VEIIVVAGLDLSYRGTSDRHQNRDPRHDRSRNIYMVLNKELITLWQEQPREAKKQVQTTMSA
jgi:hypothetical protein